MMLEPTSEERAMLATIAERIRVRIENLGAEAIIGGSYAKDTWLSGSRDLDIFARFDVASEAELEQRILSLFEAFPEAEHVRGSRAYLRFETDGVIVEIIPIRPLSVDANTMDHSPDHITYVREHLGDPNEVRTLKLLLRANGIYGAESHVRGFSGYVCELLMIRYKTLENLARSASAWEPGMRIAFHENAPAFTETFIIEDPTEPNRNAAAAVDERSFTTFTNLMGRFATGTPIEALLEPERIEPPFVRIVMHPTHEKPDVGFAQLRAIHERLERELEPFGVRRAQWFAHDAWESRFSLERTELDTDYVRIGPPLRLKKAVSAFRDRHPESYEQDGHIVATVHRKETRWDQIVARIAAHPHVASYSIEEVR